QPGPRPRLPPHARSPGGEGSGKADRPMTIAVAVKGAGAIALASDSRRSFFPHGVPSDDPSVRSYLTRDDDAKVFLLPEPHSWVAVALAGGGGAWPSAA